MDFPWDPFFLILWCLSWRSRQSICSKSTRGFQVRGGETIQMPPPPIPYEQSVHTSSAEMSGVLLILCMPALPSLPSAPSAPFPKASFLLALQESAQQAQVNQQFNDLSHLTLLKRGGGVTWQQMYNKLHSIFSSLLTGFDSWDGETHLREVHRSKCISL